jgi:hypothetical protein
MELNAGPVPVFLRPRRRTWQFSVERVDKPTDNNFPAVLLARRLTPIRAPLALAIRRDRARALSSRAGAIDQFNGATPKIAMELDMDDMDCPVCGTTPEEISTTADGLRIVCSTCGEYDISSAVLDSEQWQRLDPEDRCDVLEEAKRSAQPNAHPVIATYLLASAAP